MTGLLLHAVELAGRRRADVLVRGGRVAAVGDDLRREAHDEVIDARGGALLPGLHDHHAHLAAMAAAAASVACGPPAVRDRGGLRAALAAAAAGARPGAWLRGVGYHESVAGDLDAVALDALLPDHPVRVQHRGGALWMLNTAALRAIGLGPGDQRAPRTDAVTAGTGTDSLPEGVERDAAGAPTGRLWRLDTWLRARLGPAPPPDLGAVGRELAAYGVTGVTDATPDLTPDGLALLCAAAADGRLPQRLHLLGADTAASATTEAPGAVTVGARKLLPPDHDPWPYPELVARIRAARATGTGKRPRPVAVHCVTAAGLVLLLAALRETGTAPGDRVEHAAVVPPPLAADLRDLGVRVVTQPGFVADRGDAYLADVDPRDLPHLYPYASLLAAGVPVAIGSDAPFGSADPWAALRAARDRRTTAGRPLGEGERVPAATALRGLLTPLTFPGGPARRIAPGVRADLCLLRVPRRHALAEPSAELVRATWCAGRRAYAADG